MENIERLLDRPRNYYNIDGVAELGMGFFMLSFSVLYWIMLHTPESSLWHSIYVLVAFMTVTSIVVNYGCNAIKKHITYPRTGFVEYRPTYKTVKGWVRIAISSCAAALISAGMVLAIKHRFSISTLVSLYGLPLAVGYRFRARKMYLNLRWKWIVFLAMVAASFAITLLPAGLLDSLAGHTHMGTVLTSQALGAFWLTWVVYGALILLSGGTTFYLYLHSTQAPVPEE
jgi:hypothetical protein